MTYSSQQVARRLGISPSALSKYVLNGKIPTPRSVRTGDITVYLWTEEEIEHVRKLLPTIANGRKTRYQKLREKASKENPKTQPRAAALHKTRKKTPKKKK